MKMIKRKPSNPSFHVGQKLYDVCVHDDGKCEMDLWEVRTIRGGKVTAIQRNKWTWCKLSKTNGDWGWAKHIDALWRKTWTQGEMPDGLHRTEKAAWRAILIAAQSGKLYIDDAAVIQKAKQTAQRKSKKSHLHSVKSVQSVVNNS